MWLLAFLTLADSTQAFPVVLSPAESLQVTVAGAAAGKPVVLVPGLFGSAFTYRNVIPRLTAAGYRADRKSTRLNSSHGYISYAVFCLKKKKQNERSNQLQRNKIRR